MSIRGWVYVITNKAMPGLLKVGYSTKDPVLRAKEFAGTGTPHPYEVIYDALVIDPREVEQKAHKILSGFREGKEWFFCPITVAIQAIRKSTEKIHQETTYRATGDQSPAQSAYPKCARDGCTTLAIKDYKGRALCESHWYLERQAGLGIVCNWDARDQYRR